MILTDKNAIDKNHKGCLKQAAFMKCAYYKFNS